MLGERLGDDKDAAACPKRGGCRRLPVGWRGEPAIEMPQPCDRARAVSVREGGERRIERSRHAEVRRGMAKMDDRAADRQGRQQPRGAAPARPGPASRRAGRKRGPPKPSIVAALERSPDGGDRATSARAGGWPEPPAIAAAAERTKAPSPRSLQGPTRRRCRIVTCRRSVDSSAGEAEKRWTPSPSTRPTPPAVGCKPRQTRSAHRKVQEPGKTPGRSLAPATPQI